MSPHSVRNLSKQRQGRTQEPDASRHTVTDALRNAGLRPEALHTHILEAGAVPEARLHDSGGWVTPRGPTRWVTGLRPEAQVAQGSWTAPRGTGHSCPAAWGVPRGQVTRLRWLGDTQRPDTQGGWTTSRGPSRSGKLDCAQREKRTKSCAVLGVLFVRVLHSAVPFPVPPGGTLFVNHCKTVCGIFSYAFRCRCTPWL